MSMSVYRPTSSIVAFATGPADHLTIGDRIDATSILKWTTNNNQTCRKIDLVVDKDTHRSHLYMTKRTPLDNVLVQTITRIIA
jgi:hypothetical protein